VYQPALLLKGRFDEVVLAVITGLIGCYILASGMMGHLLKSLHWLQRVFLIAAGVSMIYPGWQSDMIGITASGLIVIWQWLSLRSAKKSFG